MPYSISCQEKTFLPCFQLDTVGSSEMKLFKDKFVPRGISAEFVGELQMDTEATQRIVRGRHQLVFCGPENLFEIPALSNVSKCLGPLKDIKNTWMMQTGKKTSLVFYFING